MDVRVRCCSLTKPAADGSLIGETVVRNYLESDEYKRSIDGKLTLGYMTHRGRSLESMPDSIGNTAVLKKVVGKDDAGLCIAEGAPTFTHYVKKFYIDDVPGEGPWLMAIVHILEPNDFDDIAAENIKRLRALIKAGVKLTCSLVVVAYWDSQTNGTDICRQIKNIKSLDWTVNPSFGPLARITDVYENDLDEDERDFSEKESGIKMGEVKVKTFSDFEKFGLGNTPRTSKVCGKFTNLKVKEFSTASDVIIESEDDESQKSFSAVQVQERVRFAKLSPRERFRRLILDYRQALKAQGGIQKIDSTTLKTMKSLFAGDVLEIMKTVTPLVLQGKNMLTVLGAGALGVQVRKACQTMNIPYRQALMEVSKQGFVSKLRYGKITAAYSEFISSLQDYVFGAAPLEIEDEEEGSK